MSCCPKKNFNIKNHRSLKTWTLKGTSRWEIRQGTRDKIQILRDRTDERQETRDGRQERGGKARHTVFLEALQQRGIL